MTETAPGATVALDLSNLCRDRRLLADGVDADLDLFDRFVDTMAVSGKTIRHITAVADRSLIPLLDAKGRRRLRDLERDHVVEFSSLADERLLELAFGTESNGSTLVASMDSFDDFRRTYPEIQGSRDRFLGWEAGPDRSLRVTSRDMGVHTHRRVSRKEERAELKARRLHRDSVVRRATATYFRCESAECLLAQLWPERLPDLPRYDDHNERFVCPSCGQPVRSGDPRPPAAQLIIFLDGAEQFRLLIEQHQRILIGRNDGPGQVGLASRLRAGAADAISRSHLEMELLPSGLQVMDLGSRNGTALRTPSAPDIRLVSGNRQIIGRRDTIALPAGITIELSGRSVPQQADGARAGDPRTNSDRSTRLMSVKR